MRKFTFTIDHDIPYGLGYTPTEDDASHMAWLRRDKVRTRLFGVPFDYPLRTYTFQLADYFIRGSENAPRTGGTDHALETNGIQGIEQALGHMCFSFETIEAPGSMIVAPPSPSRASVFSMCFLEEVLYDADGVTLSDIYIDEMDIIDADCILYATSHKPHSAFDMLGISAIDFEDVTLYDAYADAMDMISIGCILDAAPPGPLSIFYMFGISMLEINDDDGLLATDIIHNIVYVEGAFDSMDPLLSFDTMSGFVTRFDDISNCNNDTSIF